MAITYRPMRPRHVRECVQIVAASPVQAPPYGASIRDLSTVWQRLLGQQAFRAFVFEESQDHLTPTKVGVGVTAFISDEFLQYIKTPPFFWVYPELIRHIASGESPLLSDNSIGRLEQKPLQEIFELPHYVGMTREVGISRLGSWVGLLFMHEPARFGFRPSEQRLLLTALRGGTDEQLANNLGLSLSAVQKMWLSIYERVSTHLPSLLPNRASGQESVERGREKKQRLLNYLREHPEELRPASP